MGGHKQTPSIADQPGEAKLCSRFFASWQLLMYLVFRRRQPS
jgi:hypothetical protein